ncbi:MAG TPA: AraC family ligand binding domain-containing protein [Chloroflexota bacterium]
MTRIFRVAVVVVVLGVASSGHGGETKEGAQSVPADTPQAIFRNYQDFKWNRILPDLGENSPEICFLANDPKTQATKLMIRAPKGIHVRKHWHSANETHTVILGVQVFACEGKRVEQGPGSFNYLPAKMVHEAWLPAASLVFITVDGAWDVNWVKGPPTAADLAK